MSMVALETRRVMTGSYEAAVHMNKCLRSGPPSMVAKTGCFVVIRWSISPPSPTRRAHGAVPAAQMAPTQIPRHDLPKQLREVSVVKITDPTTVRGSIEVLAQDALVSRLARLTSRCRLTPVAVNRKPSHQYNCCTQVQN